MLINIWFEFVINFNYVLQNQAERKTDLPKTMQLNVQQHPTLFLSN